MTTFIGDMDSAGYEFNHSTNYESTYSKINELESTSTTMRDNLEDSNRELTEAGGEISLFDAVGNALSVLVNSIGYVVGSDGVVASASSDLGLNIKDQSGNSWIPLTIIIIFVITIGFIIASLWLRHEA